MDIYLKLNIIKNNNKIIPNERIADEEITIPFENGRYDIEVLDIKSITLKEISKSPTLAIELIDGKKYESNLSDDQYPLAFPFVFVGISYLIKYTYCIKVNDEFFEIKNLNIDLISLEEINDIAEKLEKFYQRIISLKNLKYFLINRNVDAINSYYYKISIEDRVLDSIKSIEHSLEVDIAQHNLEDLYINLLQEISPLINNSQCVNSKKLQDYIKDLKERVIIKINSIFLENEKRVEQIKRNSFEPSNGEFVIYYKNMYDGSVKKGNIRIAGFDENALPIITIDSEILDKNFYLYQRRYKDLYYFYKQKKMELKDYWNDEISDSDNIEILKKGSFSEEKFKPQMIEINDSMTREQIDAYASHNCALARGLVKAEPSIQEKITSLIEDYEIIYER